MKVYLQGLGPSDVVLDVVRQYKPAIFKMVDPDVGWVRALIEASPETVLIGRLVEDHQGRLTAREGRAFADRILRKSAELGGHIQWWEGSNEAISGGIDDMLRLCEFEQAFAERIQREGLHALVGGFSTGTPQIVQNGSDEVWMGEWSTFYPALQEAHGAHFHEYWHPQQLNDRWNAFRYQMWYPRLPRWARDKWWLVSELGIDGGLAGAGRKGWRDYVDEDQYLALLRGYGADLARFPRIAATVFCAGLGPDRSWQSFDLTENLLHELGRMWRPDERWGDMVKHDISVLDRELKQALNAAGIEYDNIISVFPDLAPQNFRARTPSQIEGWAFHHSAGPERSSSRAIYQANINRGLGGMAYHFLAYCYRSGDRIYRKLRLARNPLQWGAHVKDQNEKWIGYCWVGTYHDHVPDRKLLEAQAEMLRIVRQVTHKWLGTDEQPVKAHNEIMGLNYTQCPDGGRWFRDKFIPLLGGESPESDDYTRGWNDALAQAIAALSQELERLRRD